MTLKTVLVMKLPILNNTLAGSLSSMYVSSYTHSSPMVTLSIGCVLKNAAICRAISMALGTTSVGMNQITRMLFSRMVSNKQCSSGSNKASASDFHNRSRYSSECSPTHCFSLIDSRLKYLQSRFIEIGSIGSSDISC